MHVSAVLLYSDGPSLQGSNRFLWKVAGSGQCATHAADGTSNAETITLTWAICGWGSSQRQNARLTQNATNPTLALRSTAQPRAIVVKYSQAGTRPQLSSPTYLNARAPMFMSALLLHGRDPLAAKQMRAMPAAKPTRCNRGTLPGALAWSRRNMSMLETLRAAHSGSNARKLTCAPLHVHLDQRLATKLIFNATSTCLRHLTINTFLPLKLCL